jgi:hypothetical protein
MSSACFEPHGFILRKTVVNAFLYSMFACSGVHQCNVFLRMNPWVSKYVEYIKNWKTELKYKSEKSAFRWFMFVIISQCRVQKALKNRRIICSLTYVIFLGTYLAGHETNFYWILSFRLFVIVHVLPSVIVVTTIVTLTFTISSFLGRNLCWITGSVYVSRV